MFSDQLRNLFHRAQAGQRRALGQLLSVAESDEERYLEVADQVRRSGRGVLRVGITGAGGVGKSTLIDALVRGLRGRGLKVAVVAVDPSSDRTKGALLGDRVRTRTEIPDPGFFLRSVASRGAHGGLAHAVDDFLDVLDACGFDLLLVEAIGAGQSETGIADLCDRTLLVLQPGSGDRVQTMKAGLLERADWFVINKADQDGAEPFAELLRSTLDLSVHTSGDHSTPVLLVSATQGVGIEELVQLVEHCARGWAGSPDHARRDRCRLARRLRRVVDRRVELRMAEFLSEAAFDPLFERWQNGEPAERLAIELLQRTVLLPAPQRADPQ